MLRAISVSSEISIPRDFMCRITRCIMRDPVIAADGVTYEREAIEDWLQQHTISPQTGSLFKNDALRSNEEQLEKIKNHLDRHPSLKNSPRLYLPKAWIRDLISALKANRLDEVRHWLAQDLRLLTQPLQGDYRAFHLAAAFGSSELTKALWSQMQSQGQTETVFPKPMYFKAIYLNELLEQALEQSDRSQAEQWLRLGADVEQPDESGDSLLARCLCRGDVSNMAWLLGQGALVASCNRQGNTPLHLSILYHQPAITTLLLDHQADPISKNIDAQSSLDLARNLQSGDGLMQLWVASQAAPLAVGTEEEARTFLPAYTQHASSQHQVKDLDTPAYYRLGLAFYNKGLYSKALAFFLALSQDEQSPYYPRACLKLWRIYQCGNGIVPEMATSDRYGQQVAAYVPWFIAQAATAGDPEADYNLGELYAGGLGVPVDDAGAYHCYKRAAATGHPLAQCKRGYFYREGQGATLDYSAAKAWFERSALQENVIAQHSLGDLYAQQDSVLSNRHALRWYEQAARQGHAPAQCSLAALYFKGASGVPQNHRQARFWYTCAAVQEDLDAQYALALFYEQGLGGAQDKAQARMWYTRALAKGHREAHNRLGILQGSSALNPAGDEIQACLGYQPVQVQRERDSVAEPSIPPFVEAPSRTPKRPRVHLA